MAKRMSNHAVVKEKEQEFASEGTIIEATLEKTSPEMATKILALVEESLDDDQANDVKVVPLAGKTDIADYMVIASGRSARHVDAMVIARWDVAPPERERARWGVKGAADGD